jgi:Domain of unknown function (DUF4347)
MKGERTVASHIYLVDVRTSACWGWNKGSPITKSGEGSCYLFNIQPLTEPDRMVDKILGWSSVGEIEVLRIMGHGTAGYIQLGRTGLTVPTMGWLKKIAARFAAGSRMELHCCNVAAESKTPLKDYPKFPGDGLCHTMANYTGAAVLAGTEPQYADADWEFEGPVRAYSPYRDGMGPADLSRAGERPGVELGRRIR